MSADDIIRRMRLIFGVRSDSALASELHLATSAPSNWRQRNRPPFATCVTIAEQRGISLDWLIFGIGDMWQEAAGQVRDTSEATYRTSSEAARRITRFVSMWDASRSAEEMIWLEQHLKRSIPEYRVWLERDGKHTPDASIKPFADDDS